MITYNDFEKIDMRVGTIIDVQEFPQAKKPAYKLLIDLGPEIGIKRSSAQITQRYSKDDLLGKQVLTVVNFPEKQIGSFFSQVLTLGLADENQQVILITPDFKIQNGSRLF